MKFAIVIEKSKNGYGAYAPDLPGCGVVGDTAEEVEGLIREAIDLHLEGLRESGLPVPGPSTICKYVEAGAA